MNESDPLLCKGVAPFIFLDNTWLNFTVTSSNLVLLTLWTQWAGSAAYANRGAKNPTGRFSSICCGVSKTWRASKPAHVRSTINWFVYTGRYQATLRSQVESSSLFSFRTTYNLLMGFCTRCMILRRKYDGDTQCIWRYWYSLDVMDIEELYNQKSDFERETEEYMEPVSEQYRW